MQRFTYYDAENEIAFIFDEQHRKITGPWVDRLAAYEDFGYLPHEMKVVEAKIKVDVEQEDIHKLWVDVMKLPPYYYNRLWYNPLTQYMTVFELAHLQDHEISRIRGVGKGARKCIADELARFGITGTAWSDAE